MIKFIPILVIALLMPYLKADEKSKIVETLSAETEAFCNKEFERWESYWLHENTSYKNYFRDCQYIEYDGWLEIRQFAADYFAENPKPESIPEESKDYEVTVRDNLAWVKYEVKDSIRGNKKEFRRLIKDDGKWKISYMSTVYE